MNHRVAVRARHFSNKLKDEARFFRSWVENPLKTGAVSPSGPALSKLMAREAELDREGPVVELGPGTGVVTKALVARGIDPARLVAVEYNPDFCVLLHRRFPDIHVVRGDAYALRTTLKDVAPGSLASMISSLPLFTRPPAERRALLRDALDLLQPGAPFIQFSYALVPPVPAISGEFTVERSPWVLMNLPPARVWIYRKA